MDRIRVLIVDDSVVVRRLLSDIVSAEEDMEVVDTAPNGRVAMEKLDGANPDIVTLDVEMPEMDGLETLVAIRKKRRALPVIMFSTLTSRGAATTIEALSHGASDYITKPEGVSGLREGMERIRQELVPRLRALARTRGGRPLPAPVAAVTAAPRRPGPAPVPVARPRVAGFHGPVEAIVIGVSTGGPNALAALLPMLPADPGAPILIVQHMPPLFTRMLADRLNDRCALHVREAVEGARPQRGEAWIARGDWHMELNRDRGGLVIHEHQGAQENSCRPAVDVLFRSALQACGGGLLAVVLTGMGRDGTRGAEGIRQAGGSIVVQDQETSVVWGMPGSIVEAGLADAVLPIDSIAKAILARAGRSPLSQGARNGAN